MTFFGLKLQGQDQENRAAHPNQELPGKPPCTGFLVASRGSAIHVFLVLKKHRGFYEASKQMTNNKAGVESALYYNVRFPKRIYNNTWQKRPFRIGYNYLLKALFFFCLFCCCFFFTNICARDCKCNSQSSAHYSQLFRQLSVAFGSAFLHDVAAALFVLLPKPIDPHPSKPFISLVPMTCTTYCFKGQGHCFVMHHPYCFSSQLQTLGIGAGRPFKTMNDSHVG